MSATGPSTDQVLLRIVAAPEPDTIEAVIERMNLLDASLPSFDGLKWFNWLYLLVTDTLKNGPPAAGWQDPAWLTRLDVVFASFYFDVIESALTGRATAKSWRALFEARHKPGIDRIQFALAGMNAHINRDLSLALLQTDAEFDIVPGKTSRQHVDFEHVNQLLGSMIPQALSKLATGIVGEVVQDTGKIGRLTALWDVKVARDLAWDFADHLRNLNGLGRDFALTAQDRLTGALGRSLLAI